MKVSFNVLMFFHSISLNSKYPPLNKYQYLLLFVFVYDKDDLKISQERENLDTGYRINSDLNLEFEMFNQEQTTQPNQPGMILGQ